MTLLPQPGLTPGHVRVILSPNSVPQPLRNFRFHCNSLNQPLGHNHTMDKAQAEDYLHSLLNKALRVTTDDTRMFMGRFKCTDSVCPSPPSPQPSTPNSLPSQWKRTNYPYFPPHAYFQSHANQSSPAGQKHNPHPSLRIPFRALRRLR